MGEVKVLLEAYDGAQTQRAVENFPVSGISDSRGNSFTRSRPLSTPPRQPTKNSDF